MDYTKPDDWEREVAGEYNTFRVYLYLLRVKNGSVRKVQRALGFSSPHLARHHLKKLTNLGLVKPADSEGYQVVPKSFGILKFFIVTGKWVVPRSIFTVVIFAALTIAFTFYLPLLLEHDFLWIVLVVAVAGLAISLYETVRFYRLLPKT